MNMKKSVLILAGIAVGNSGVEARYEGGSEPF
jgi:hypothetical protein